MNEEKKSISGTLGTQKSEELEVGEEFTGSKKQIAEIIKKLKLKKNQVPDFLSCHAAAAEAMVALGKRPFVRVVPDNKFVCSFEHNDRVVVTVPQGSAPAAMTCALYFALKISQ